MQTDRIIEFVDQIYILIDNEISWIEQLLYLSISISLISFSTTISLRNKIHKLLNKIEQDGKNNTSININQK